MLYAKRCLLHLLEVCFLVDMVTPLWGPGSIEPVVEQLAADLNSLKLRVEAMEAASNRKVAFSAFVAKNGNIQASSNQIIPFSAINTNTGGAYFNKTSVFRAPYDGDYFFIVSADVSRNYNGMKLVLNNDNMILSIDKDDGVRTHVTGSGIFNLKAGDVVTVRHRTGRGYVDDGKDSTFSGFYLGESDSVTGQQV